MFFGKSSGLYPGGIFTRLKTAVTVDIRNNNPSKLFIVVIWRLKREERQKHIIFYFGNNTLKYRIYLRTLWK